MPYRALMDVVTWLLDSDPALRWQVLADLTDAPAQEVAAERARVATTGWGGALLAEQAEDGRWDGGTYRPGWAREDRPFFDAWTATHHVLQELADLGVDPASPEVRRAVGRVRDNVRWEHEDEPYFAGEVEPCINGIALRTSAYFGEDGGSIAATLLGTRLPDGGWNCWAEDATAVSSFHSTICAVEGLLAWERTGAATPEAAEARATGEEYLLARGLFRRRSDGTVADLRMTMLSYPTRWYHDILRGLEHFRVAGRRDERLAEVVDVLRAKADTNGMWHLENAHQGPCWLDYGEGEGFPSRWLTFRALRVLRWWDGV